MKAALRSKAYFFLFLFSILVYFTLRWTSLQLACSTTHMPLSCNTQADSNSFSYVPTPATAEPPSHCLRTEVVSDSCALSKPLSKYRQCAGPRLGHHPQLIWTLRTKQGSFNFSSLLSLSFSLSSGKDRLELYIKYFITIYGTMVSKLLFIIIESLRPCNVCC